jgi:hypothetical protein
MPATILAAHHSLFAVPNLAEWNAYHGCDRGVTKWLRVGVLPTVDAEGAVFIRVWNGLLVLLGP